MPMVAVAFPLVDETAVPACTVAATRSNAVETCSSPHPCDAATTNAHFIAHMAASAKTIRITAGSFRLPMPLSAFGLPPIEALTDIVLTL